MPSSFRSPYGPARRVTTPSDPDRPTTGGGTGATVFGEFSEWEEVGTSMAKFLYSAAMSLDGFIAGPGGDMSW